MTELADRRLWATLTLGSHLYGTTVPESDIDILNLYIPEIEEMVDNRHVRLPQCIRDGVDTRRLLLGDFVMSLGVNAEHMVLAYHYPMFNDLATAWLTGRALNNLLDASHNMWVNAKTPKNKAHAHRYTQAAYDMAYGHTLYPLNGPIMEAYMGLRNDAPGQVSDEAFRMWHGAVRDAVKRLWRSDQYADRRRMAEWVMLRYLGLAE